jgi:hypothetical protein
MKVEEVVVPVVDWGELRGRVRVLQDQRHPL